MSWDDAGRLLLRGSLAAVFGYAAVKHARKREGTETWLASEGYPKPDLSWAAMTATESAATVTILLGAGTSMGVAALNGAMTSAAMVVHRPHGWAEEDGGVEWPVTLMLVATALAALGPGRWSLDHALGLDRRLDGGVGVSLAAAGVLAGLAQASTVKRPAS